MLGDVNGDGKVNAIDARNVLRVGAQLETFKHKPPFSRRLFFAVCCKKGNKKSQHFCADKKMERMTRLELATSTLARWRSTR